jgi:SAM-dependent methyltransferase
VPAQPSDLAVDRNGAENTFGEFYYAHDCGIPYERNDHWLTFFGAIADGIVERLRPRTVLDVGCAMGFLVEALRDRGVGAWGIDVSEYAIARVGESTQSFCVVAAADGPLPAAFPARFDLVTCVEVLEHIDTERAAAALMNLCRWGDRVLFSSSSTDYGEPTHVNVKRGEVWAAHFAERGYLRNFDVDVSFLTPWAVLYEPALTTVPTVVARYEREYAEARRENIHLRHRVVDSDRQRAELEADVRRLTAELEKSESKSVTAQELAAARDEAVAAKLRVAQLRQRAKDLEGQVDSREHTIWELLADLEHLRSRAAPTDAAHLTDVDRRE